MRIAGRTLDLGQPLLAATLLCLLVLLLNANDLQGYFVGDDFDILREVVQQDSLFDVLDMVYADTWNPFSYAQFYLNYQLGGFNPLVYHLTNLFWLCVAVVTLFAFVRQAWPEAPFAAWAAALLFAVHPVHDEAVAYICGRSHTIATALALLAMVLYARFRLAPARPRQRAWLLAGALACGFLAGLTKESALTLPAWIVAFDWLWGRAPREPLWYSIRRAVSGGVLFTLNAGAVLGARVLAVGESRRQLQDTTVTIGEIWGDVAADVPIYALYGGLPIPFSWMSLEDRLWSLVLGWTLVSAAMAIGLVCLWVNYAVAGEKAKAAGLYVLGLIIATVTLLPLMYADFSPRRRYLFIASVGIVLMAAAGLTRWHARSSRAVLALAILVAAGSAGVVHRNELYRRSGEIAKNVVETVVGAPLTRQLVEQGASGDCDVVMITFPRRYGGDDISGAHLLHFTDFRSVCHMVGLERPRLAYSLKTYYVEDYSARAEFSNPSSLELIVSFRTRRAFEAARRRNPREDRRGSYVTAYQLGSDPASRSIRYRIRLRFGFWFVPRRRLFLYSDGRLVPLRP